MKKEKTDFKIPRPTFPKRAVVTAGMPYGNKNLHFGHIGGVFEDFGSSTNHRREQIQNVQDVLGDVNWKTDFMNSGVFVCDKEHRYAFKIWEDCGFYDGCYEQTNTNWYFRKQGYPFYSLHYNWNFLGLMRVFHGPIHREAYFIHYAGRGIVTWLPREEQMKADYSFFYDQENYDPELDPLSDI